LWQACSFGAGAKHGRGVAPSPSPDSRPKERYRWRSWETTRYVDRTVARLAGPVPSFRARTSGLLVRALAGADSPHPAGRTRASLGAGLIEGSSRNLRSTAPGRSCPTLSPSSARCWARTGAGSSTTTSTASRMRRSAKLRGLLLSDRTGHVRADHRRDAQDPGGGVWPRSHVGLRRRGT